MTQEAIEKILKEKIAEERSKLPTHERSYAVKHQRDVL